MPPPIVNGMNTSLAVRRARSTIVSRRSCDAVMSRNTISSPPSASYRQASSTGSPASRMSTKLVPFTTRPLSTSRHGITRLSSTGPLLQDVLRLADREALLVQSLPRDHPGEVHESQLLQRAQVVQRADAARVEEATADHLAHAANLVEVRAVQHPVPVNVGVDELLHAALLHALDHGLGKHLRGLRPAGHRHVALAHVDGHHDAHAPQLEHPVEELEVGVGGRAEHHARGARQQRLAHRHLGAEAAAVLHRDLELLRDPLEVPQVHRPALARAIQVHHVELSGSVLHPRPRGLERIVDVDGLLVEVALAEAHRLPAADVDRGQEDHAARRSADAAMLVKFRRSRSPFSLDFSGWNCVPYTGPRSTALTNWEP